MEKIKELTKFLKDKGYKEYTVSESDLNSFTTFKTLLKKSVDSEVLCECNDNLCIDVSIASQHFLSGTVLNRAEISITAQLHNKWWNLKCYSLTPEEAIVQFDEVEQTLIKLFNTIG